MLDGTSLLQALIALAATAITACVIPYIKSRIGAEQLERTRAWAEIGVKAAEQIYSGHGRGREKMTYALDVLKARGFAVNTDEIIAFVESAVGEMKAERGCPMETED